MSKCPVHDAMRRLLGPEGYSDPHPLYADLREAASLHEVPHFGATVTRYTEVRDVLFDRSLSVSSAAAKPESPHALIQDLLPPDLKALPPPLFLQDDPSHKRLRKLVAEAFSQKSIDAMALEILTIADDLIGQMPRRGCIDIVDLFAAPLPARVVCKILGVEGCDPKTFRKWSEDVINELHPLATAPQRDAAIHAHRQLVATFRAELRARCDAPGEGLLGHLAEAVFSRHELSEDEAVSLCCNLMVAGHYTTTDLISNLVHLLLTYPTERAKLESDGALWPAAVEEALRFEPPTPLLARIMPAACTRFARDFDQGEAINVFVASANRDPRVYDDPNRFNVSRERRPHLSFGGGTHYCLGAPLARAEAQIAVRRLFERCAALSIADDNLVWRRSRSFRGLERLILRIDRHDEVAPHESTSLEVA